MPAHLTAKARHRAEQTGKAMRSMMSACPHCKRRGNFRSFDYTGVGNLMWQCHYCKETWTADPATKPNT